MEPGKCRGKEAEELGEYWEWARQSLSCLERFCQHGDTTCLLHSVAVAYYSSRLANWLGIRFHRKELLRGALLHDYFLYDWHDHTHRFHGFTHPRTALQNAQRDFILTGIEKDIILKHMFPLTFSPPACRESILVCLVDKGCSLYETFGRNTYPLLRRRLEAGRIGTTLKDRMH